MCSSSLSVERAWESVRLERYAELCRIVRFNRSMNDVFNVEESSELLSASSNRSRGSVQRSAFDLDDTIVPARFENLAVETRWPEEATDDFLVEFESIRDDQGRCSKFIRFERSRNRA